MRFNQTERVRDCMYASFLVFSCFFFAASFRWNVARPIHPSSSVAARDAPRRLRGSSFHLVTLLRHFRYSRTPCSCLVTSFRLGIGAAGFPRRARPPCRSRINLPFDLCAARDDFFFFPAIFSPRILASSARSRTRSREFQSRRHGPRTGRPFGPISLVEREVA